MPARAESSRRWNRVVPDVGAFEPEMEARSDEELRALTGELKGRLDRAGDLVTERERRLDALDDLLPEAFAARPRGGAAAPSASGTSTSSSWAAPPCTSAGSPR